MTFANSANRADASAKRIVSHGIPVTAVYEIKSILTHNNLGNGAN